MLEKKRILKKIEFSFHEDEVSPVCHCVYHDAVLEDGKVLSHVNHRAVEDTDACCDKIKAMKKMVR